MPKNNPGYQVFELDAFKEFLIEERINRCVSNIVVEHTKKVKLFDYDEKKPINSLFDLDIHHRHLGYSSVCNHLVILPDGKVGVCRPFNDIPGGLPKNMSEDISVAVMGDLDTETMPGIQQQSFLDVVAMLCRKFNFQPDYKHVNYANWYDISTGELDYHAENATRISSPGVNFFGGNSFANAQQEFFLLLGVKFKIHKNVSENSKQYSIGKVIVTSDKLRVRDESDVSGDTIDFIQRGTTLRIFERVDEWYKIDGAESRWVSSRFVSEI